MTNEAFARVRIDRYKEPVAAARNHEMLAREAKGLLILDQEIGVSQRSGITLDRNPANQEWQFGDMNGRRADPQQAVSPIAIFRIGIQTVKLRAAPPFCKTVETGAHKALRYIKVGIYDFRQRCGPSRGRHGKARSINCCRATRQLVLVIGEGSSRD